MWEPFRRRSGSRAHDRVRCPGHRRLEHPAPAAHHPRARDGPASLLDHHSATRRSTCSATRSAARSRRRCARSTHPASTASCSRPPAAVGAPCPVIRSRCWRCSRPARYYFLPGHGGGRLVVRCEQLGDFATADAARLHRPPDPLGYWWQLLAALGWSSLPWLHRVRVPTLVLAAARDRLVRASTARTLARRIPGARLEVVPGANHFFLLREDTRAATRLVTTFLDEQEQVRPTRSWPARSCGTPTSSACFWSSVSRASRRIALSVSRSRRRARRRRVDDTGLREQRLGREVRAPGRSTAARGPTARAAPFELAQVRVRHVREVGHLAERQVGEAAAGPG